MVSETGNLDETIAALVAKLCVASVAGHVITPSGSLDVHLTERTFLTVCDTGMCVSFGPLGELLVSLSELPAGHVVVPGGVATEAPVMVALLALDPNIFLSEPPST